MIELGKILWLLFHKVLHPLIESQEVIRYLLRQKRLIVIGINSSDISSIEVSSGMMLP